MGCTLVYCSLSGFLLVAADICLTSTNNDKIPQFHTFFFAVLVFYTNFVAICAYINEVRNIDNVREAC